MDTNGSKKTLTITGADGRPVEIEAGAYYLNPKARCHRIMREPLSGEANRVHACLELATMGFRQELAVKLERGRKVPLTPADISQQTGLIKQNVRRGLAELERAGLAERRPADGSSSLQKGKILIYSWAVPRQKSPHTLDNEVIARDYQIPPSWKPLIAVSKRLKIKLDPEKLKNLQDDDIRAGEVVARDYQQAEMVVARFLEGVSARLPNAPAIRKEIKGKIRTTKDTHTPAAPVSAPPVPVPVEAPVVRVSSPLPSQEEKPKPEPPKEPHPRGSRNGFTRLDEFLRRYPDRSDPLGARMAYGKANTPESENACHACLDRYLESDQVHRGIVMRADRWLKEQQRNNWEGDWARVRNGSSLDQRAEDYARRRKEEKARAHR